MIDAFGAWTPETLPQHSTSLKHLCDILSGSSIRLLVVGGAGSLYVDPAHTAQVMDGVDFPDMFKPLATNKYGKGTGNGAPRAQRCACKWTYISPAADFQADGAKTGKYILGGEELTLNGKGESVISYADYAIAMVDEAISGEHIQEGDLRSGGMSGKQPPAEGTGGCLLWRNDESRTVFTDAAKGYPFGGACLDG